MNTAQTCDMMCKENRLHYSKYFRVNSKSVKNL